MKDSAPTSSGSTGVPTAGGATSPLLALSLLVIHGVWGANFLFVDIAVRDLSPAMMMGARFTIAGLLLLPVSRRFGPRARDRTGMWRESLENATLLFAGGSGLLAWGLVHLDSGVAAMLLSTIPAWVVIMDLASSRRWITVRAAAGLGTGLVGVALIVRPDLTSRVDPLGSALVLGAALSWAAGSHRSRAIPSEQLLERSAMQMTAGGAILLVVGFALWSIGVSPGAVTVASFTAMLWLITVSSMLGFTAYTYALLHAPISAVAAYPYTNTAIAIVLGILVLGERLTPHRAAGTALVLLAVRLLTVGQPTAEQTPRRRR